MLYEYDATKEACPLPLVKMRLILKKMQPEDACLIRIADKGSKVDIPKYLVNKGYKFSARDINKRIIEIQIIKGS